MSDSQLSRIITFADLSKSAFGTPLGPDLWLYEGMVGENMNQFYPVRFDALLVMLVHSGRACMGVDVRKYHLEPNTLGVLRPGCYLTSFEIEGDGPLTATVLGCTEKVEDRIAPTLDDIMPLLLKSHIDPVMKLKDGGVEALKPYIDLLKTVAGNSADNTLLAKKAACLFKAAIYEVMDKRVTDPEHSFSGRNREISAHFLFLLGQHFRHHRDLEFYASKMSITPKHLSTVLKAEYGLTAGKWIEDYVVREAKILLTQTSMQIKDVATRLNFSSQAFFGKYFRNATGISPSEFRSQNK